MNTKTKHEIIPVGYLATNCTVMWDEDKNGIVVDPGDAAATIIDFIKQNDIDVKYVLLTHNHFDHTGALQQVLEFSKAKLAIGEHDNEKLPATPDILFSGGDTLNCGEITVVVLSTPGHTKGSVCYIVGDVMLSGDTLFAGDIGRTDLPGGSFTEIKKSLKIIKNLPVDDIKIIPGHEETTTLAHEREHNQYLK